MFWLLAVVGSLVLSYRFFRKSRHNNKNWNTSFLLAGSSPLLVATSFAKTSTTTTSSSSNMGQSRQDQRRDLSRGGLRSSSSIMETPNHGDDSARENCRLSSSPCSLLDAADETTITKQATAVLGNKTNSRADAVVVSITAVVTPMPQNKNKEDTIFITPPSTPPKEHTFTQAPNKQHEQVGADNTSENQGFGHDTNDNEMWQFKVDQSKEKLSEATIITTPAAASTAAAVGTMDTITKDDDTNSTSTTQETAHTNGSTTTTENNKNHHKKKDYKMVAEAVGDILVERILHTDPTLLDTVAVEEWEVLLALPVPVMVDLLRQLDSNDNENDNDNDVTFGWKNVQSFVSQYHKKNNEKAHVVV